MKGFQFLNLFTEQLLEKGTAGSEVFVFDQNTGRVFVITDVVVETQDNGTETPTYLIWINIDLESSQAHVETSVPTSRFHEQPATGVALNTPVASVHTAPRGCCE